MMILKKGKTIFAKIISEKFFHDNLSANSGRYWFVSSLKFRIRSTAIKSAHVLRNWATIYLKQQIEGARVIL